MLNGLLGTKECPEFLFLRKELPVQEVDLSDEALEMNFMPLCPFEDCKIFFVVKNKNLMVWLYENNKKWILPPYCLVFALSFLSEGNDLILIFSDRKKHSFFVIKNGIIVSAFQVPSNIDIAKLKTELQRKYHITKIIQYNAGIERNIGRMVSFYLKGLLTLLRTKAEYDKRSIFRRGVFIITSIILVFFFIGNIIKFVNLSFLFFEEQKIDKIINTLEKKASNAKSKFFFLEKRAQLWSGLEGRLDERLKQLEQILNYLIGKGYVRDLALNKNLLILEIISDNIHWINSLSSLPFVKEINVDSVSKIGDKKLVRVQIRLR